MTGIEPADHPFGRNLPYIGLVTHTFPDQHC
jgi:hypothetical protein